MDGYGGIPAGCQFDRHSNLYVADMRLGILKVNITDGSFQQVMVLLKNPFNINAEIG